MNLKLMVGLATLYVCVPANAANYLGGKAGLYGQGLLNVTNETTLADCALTGVVYKTGSSLLALANPVSSNGTLAVENGTATVTATSANAALEGLSSVADTPVGVEVGASANLTVGTLSLGSTLVKTGLGALTVSGGCIGAGVDLQAGSLVFADCEQDSLPLAFSSSSGTTVDVTGEAISLGSAAAEGTLVKTGVGTLSVSALPAGVTNVVVSDGTLRVYPQIGGTRMCEDVEIENASFESTVGTVGDSTHSTTAYPSGWTSVNNVDDLSSSGKVGMDSKGSLWCNQADQYIPDGRLEVFLQDNCSLSKSVTLPTRGRYRISFWTHVRDIPAV